MIIRCWTILFTFFFRNDFSLFFLWTNHVGATLHNVCKNRSFGVRLICWMFIQHHYMCPCVACTGVCLRIYRENEREKRKTITQGTRPIRLMTPNSHRYYRIECPSAFFVVISLEFYCSSNSDLFALKESGVKHQHKNLLPSFLVTSWQ